MTVRRGVTRTVVVGPKRAYKIAGGLGFSYHGWFGALVRGYLANRSEWKQRTRPDVMPPSLSLFHLVLVMPAAQVSYLDTGVAPTGPWDRYTSDEGKPSSWGFFAGEGWRLIDYDRAWDPRTHRRGIVGGIYYGRQERLARKWSNLPAA